MTFGEKLKKLRKERGWSQDRLGSEIGIHGRHIGKYEIGKALPNAETIVQISNAFKVSIDYLLKEEQEKDFPTNSPLQNPILLRHFEALEQMDEQDRVVISSLIDAYVKKHQLENILIQS